MTQDHCSVAVIGAGIAGIATAYELCVRHGVRGVALIDPLPPMSLTSACSGENYRNWWPHPTMTAFTDDSIDWLEEIARQTGNRINMTRRGYVLATRDASDRLIEELYEGYGDAAEDRIRIHEPGSSDSYRPPISEDWQAAPDGVDVIRDRDVLRRSFPSFTDDIEMAIHIRRAGDISGQQLGQWMLERIRAYGGVLLTGEVVSVMKNGAFRLELRTEGGATVLNADSVVNAGGPFLKKIAGMLGVSLPVECVLQQKIAFEDRSGCIPRNLPFSIDLDGQEIDWSEEEAGLLRDDPELAWLTQKMPGAIHCRPDGAGKWIKLGWAYNQTPSEPDWEAPLNDHFPEIVLRGAARLNPGLKTYYGRLPRQLSHYGGYYTMTEENWPLIGPMGPEGAYMVGALSGFGTMAACAAGKLCAAWVTGGELPAYADDFALTRYENAPLMAALRAQQSKGVL